MSKARIIEFVKRLDLDATRTLLDIKPSLLTVTDRQGRTLVHLAASACCPRLGVPEAVSARMVNFLLDRGLDIESPIGRDKVTVLFAAVALGRNTTLLRLLLRRGAKVRSAPGGALFAAGWWDDVENLKLLIRAGAEIDIVVGVTPFLASWCWKKFEAAKVHASHGRCRQPRQRRRLIGPRIRHIDAVTPVGHTAAGQQASYPPGNRHEQRHQVRRWVQRRRMKAHVPRRIPREHTVHHHCVDVHIQIQRRPEALHDDDGAASAMRNTARASLLP